MLLLSIFGALETFISEDLYPYRFVITPLAIAVALAAAYLAYRRGVHDILLRHRMATTLIGVPALVIALVVGDYLLSPLWERSHLQEASPLVVAEAAAETSAGSTTPSQPPAANTGGLVILRRRLPGKSAANRRLRRRRRLPLRPRRRAAGPDRTFQLRPALRELLGAQRPRPLRLSLRRRVRR